MNVNSIKTKIYKNPADSNKNIENQIQNFIGISDDSNYYREDPEDKLIKREVKKLILHLGMIYPNLKYDEIFNIIIQYFQFGVINNIISFNPHTINKEITKHRISRPFEREKELKNQKINDLRNKKKHLQHIQKEILKGFSSDVSSNTYEISSKYELSSDSVVKGLNKQKEKFEMKKENIQKNNPYGIDLLLFEKKLLEEKIIDSELSSKQLVDILNNPFIKFCNFIPSDMIDEEEHEKYKQEFFKNG